MLLLNFYCDTYDLFLLQIVPSVLFFLSTISLQAVDSRRLTDDIDNEINSPLSYVKIADPPAAIIRKKVGDHVELTCEASGSPPPVIQWYRRNQRLTEVIRIKKHLLIVTLYLSLISIKKRIP